jgi:hypothetical protein
MKLARIETEAGVLEGEYEAGGTVRTDEGPFTPDEYDLRAPCDPNVFYCVGRNFGEKVDQMDYEVPKNRTSSSSRRTRCTRRRPRFRTRASPKNSPTPANWRPSSTPSANTSPRTR